MDRETASLENPIKTRYKVLESLVLPLAPFTPNQPF